MRTNTAMRLALGTALAVCPLAVALPARAQDAPQPPPAPAAAPPAQPPPVVVPPAGVPPRDGRPMPPPRRGRMMDEYGEMRVPTMMGPEGFPLAGFHGGKFFLRDELDTYRLYPGLLMQVDTRASLGRGVDELAGPAGDSTRPRMNVRRARLDLGGQIMGRWSFLVTGDLAGDKPHLEHALVDVMMHRLVHVSVGQQQVPFTMENRTDEAHYAWMERPLTVRFAQPSNKDLGVMVWGESQRAVFGYEAGVFSGDGANRGNADNRVDFAGRVHVRPLAATGTIARNIQIGFSGTYGMRQNRDVAYDMAPMATDGGYTFYDASYLDPFGRKIHVMPSGAQSGFAGEIRVPVSRLDLRFEFVSLRRNTREAVDGFQLTNTERFGHLSGSAFYAHLGVWLMGNPRMRQDPGRFRAARLAFPRGEPARPPRGLEIVLRGESLRATYTPGDRAAPAGDAAPEQTIAATVVGGGINYYATAHALVALNYGYNMFPSSGKADNAALAPGNLGCSKTTTLGGAGLPCHNGAHSLHELGARFAVAF